MKSIETNSRKWLSRNVRQVCEGGFLFFGISRETVLSEISIPSLSSSPWMRGAPHSGLACVICLIMALIRELAQGRPPIFRRDSLVQKCRKPLRCQPMTVSGLTMSKWSRHSDQIRDNQTQNRRSFVLIAGRFWVRFRMASCCRKARFSRAKLHRPLSEALNKQNSKDSNSPIPVECRAWLQKVNDINCYEVLAKDRSLARSAREAERDTSPPPGRICCLRSLTPCLHSLTGGRVANRRASRVNCHMTHHPSRVLKHAYVGLQTMAAA